MITSLYDGDTRTVVADSGSDFYDYLDCSSLDDVTQCQGTVHEYMFSFFGGKFTKDHSAQNLIILGCILLVARLITLAALHYITFSAT
jgi:hypothetical protein